MLYNYYLIISNLLVNAEQQINSYANELQLYNNKHNELSTEVTNQTSYNQELNIENEKLHEFINVLKEKISDLEKKQGVINSIKDYENHLADLQLKTRTLEELYNENNELKSKLSLHESSHTDMIDEINNLRVNNENLINQLKSYELKLRQYQNDNVNLNSLLQLRNNQYNKLSEQSSISMKDVYIKYIIDK